METLPQEALVTLFEQILPEQRSCTMANLMSLNQHFYKIIKSIAHLEHTTWFVIHRDKTEVARFETHHTHMGKVDKITGNVTNSPRFDFSWLVMALNLSKGIISYWNTTFRNSIPKTITSRSETGVSIPCSMMRVTGGTTFDITSDIPLFDFMNPPVKLKERTTDLST